MPDRGLHTEIVTEKRKILSDSIEMSSSVDDVISANPGYFVRHGIIIVVGILCLLITGMYFIRYPDTLEGTATLTTDPLPIRLKSASGGRILQLFVVEGMVVGKSMPVAELENNTGYARVLDLSSIADSTMVALERNDLTKLDQIAHRPVQSLGEAQSTYNSLVDAISTYILEQSQHIYAKRSAGLQSQAFRYQSMSTITAKEKSLIAEELRQADERFSSNEKLYQDKVISRLEYYEEAAKLRQKKIALEQQIRMGLQNSISVADNSKQLLDIRYEQQEKENKQITLIREQIRNLQNFVESWKLKYLLFAPYQGKIHFARPLQVNETIAAGEEIGAVVPSAFHYIAYVSLPAKGSGKVQIGQKVHLLLDQFPYNEYGYLEGKVRHINAIPEEGKTGTTYRIAISLSSSLITSHHRQLPFNAEMTGMARIITNDKNLLQRIAAGITSINK